MNTLMFDIRAVAEILTTVATGAFTIGVVVSSVRAIRGELDRHLEQDREAFADIRQQLSQIRDCLLFTHKPRSNQND